MTRTLLLAILLTTLLGARENPFFPATGIETLPVTSNIATEQQPLKRAAITLPDSARLLKNVTITFQNLDGTMETRTIELDHTVDWHLPLFVSQSYTQTEQRPAIPKASAQPSTTADFGFIRFRAKGKSLNIATDDTMIRHFKLTEPHRIVVDFKAEKRFRSLSEPFKHTPFTGIRIGNHKGYYRVVIELDGQYRSRVGTTPTGLQIECF